MHKQKRPEPKRQRQKGDKADSFFHLPTLPTLIYLGAFRLPLVCGAEPTRRRIKGEDRARSVCQKYFSVARRCSASFLSDNGGY